MALLKNLAQVSKDEQIKFIQSFERVIFDMDGVIWLHYNPIPGAVDCVHNLKKLNKQVHYATNNCVTTADDLQRILNERNFDAELDDIVNPIFTLVSYLKKSNVKGDIFLMGIQIIRDLLEKNGFRVLPDPPAKIEETIEGVLSYNDENRNIGAVILDFDFNVSYIKLQKAYWYLRDNPDCLFLLSISDKSAPMGPKGPLVGVYMIADALKEMTGRDYTIMGKPSKVAADFIIEKYNIQDKNKVLFIGDSITSDMAIATLAKFQKLLVLSGTTKLSDITNWEHPEEYKPKYYVENLGALNKIILEIFSNQITS